MALIAASMLAACVPDIRETGVLPVANQPTNEPAYGTVSTRLLDGDLVAIDVTMQGATADSDVIRFNDCAAAQYALIRGVGFVRRVTNDVNRSGRVWTGNGVYTLSDAHPGGVHTIDAEATAEACRTDNIPMV